MSSHEKRKRARLLLESATTDVTTHATASRMPTGGEGETSQSPASSAPPGEGEPLRTEALSSSLGKEISTSTIPTASTETSREVATSRTERSSEPLPPTARPGPSGSRVGEIPIPTETASTRKLSPLLRSLSPTPSERDCEQAGARVVQLSGLREAALRMNCPKCESQLHLYERCEGRHGLVTYMSFQCTMCPWETCITDPGAPSSNVLNTRAVLGSRLCGLGRTGIDAICGMLGLPPPFTKHSYSTDQMQGITRTRFARILHAFSAAGERVYRCG